MMASLLRPYGWSIMLFIEWTMEQSELPPSVHIYVSAVHVYVFHIFITLSFVTVV